MTKTRDLSREIDAFIGEFRSLLLATVNPDGSPSLSYAPMVQREGCFQILVSELAEHTGNLARNPAVSILFIEDEQTTAQIYARRRVSMRCEPLFVPRDTESWEASLTALKSSFGAIVETLESLKDFRLVRLSPLTGTFVKGFGEAYEFDPADLSKIRHIDASKLQRRRRDGD